jgi:hypothetical protein
MMAKPKKLHEIQQLAGRVAALEPIHRWAQGKGTSVLRTQEKIRKIQVGRRSRQSLCSYQQVLSTPVLVAPKEKEPLLLYITITHQVVSTVLVVERSEEGKAHGVQSPVYFLSEVLSPSKQRYLHYQKLV